MYADTAGTIDASNAPDTPGMIGKCGPLARRLLDKRSREWRRRGEVIAALSAAIGEAANDPDIQARIEAAAELRVIAETARARSLRGDNVSLNDLVRVERAASLAERRLGLSVGPRPKTSEPLDLAAFMRKESEPSKPSEQAFRRLAGR